MYKRREAEKRGKCLRGEKGGDNRSQKKGGHGIAVSRWEGDYYERGKLRESLRQPHARGKVYSFFD